MPAFASSLFPGANGVELSASDANWSKAAGFTANALLNGAGGCVDQFGNSNCYQRSEVPPSADYEVSVVVPQTANATVYAPGPAARIDGSGNFYSMQWFGGSQDWRLMLENAAGITTSLGSGSASLPPNTATRTVMVRCAGSTIQGVVDGVTIYTATDTTLAAAGAVGAYFYTPGIATQFAAWALSKSITPDTGALSLAGLIPSAPLMGSRILAPTSDISALGFAPLGALTLYDTLNEPIPLRDGDFSLAGGYTSSMEVLLEGGVDPNVSIGHIVHYRLQADAGGLIVALKQGSTTIASWTHSPAPTTQTTYAQTLSGGQADSITDYSDLRLYFEATA